MQSPDERVAAQIQAAAARRQRARESRAELAEARRHGLTARHARKLARLRARPTNPPPDAA
jgi:hypothetical protein